MEKVKQALRAAKEHPRHTQEVVYNGKRFVITFMPASASTFMCEHFEIVRTYKGWAHTHWYYAMTEQHALDQIQIAE